MNRSQILLCLLSAFLVSALSETTAPPSSDNELTTLTPSKPTVVVTNPSTASRLELTPTTIKVTGVNSSESAATVTASPSVHSTIAALTAGNSSADGTTTTTTLSSQGHTSASPAPPLSTTVAARSPKTLSDSSDLPTASSTPIVSTMAPPSSEASTAGPTSTSSAPLPVSTQTTSTNGTTMTPSTSPPTTQAHVVASDNSTATEATNMTRPTSATATTQPAHLPSTTPASPSSGSTASPFLPTRATPVSTAEPSTSTLVPVIDVETTPLVDYFAPIKRRSDIPPSHANDLLFAGCGLDIADSYDVFDWVYEKNAQFRHKICQALVLDTNLECDYNDVFFIRGSPLTNRKTDLLIEFGVVDTSEPHGLHLINGQKIVQAVRNRQADEISALLQCTSFTISTSRAEATAALQLEPIVSKSKSNRWLAVFTFETITVFIVSIFVIAAIVLTAVMCKRKGTRQIGNSPSTLLRTAAAVNGGNSAVYDLHTAAEILKEENNVCPYQRHSYNGRLAHTERCLEGNWVCPMDQMETVDLDSPRTNQKNGKNHTNESVDTRL